MKVCYEIGNNLMDWKYQMPTRDFILLLKNGNNRSKLLIRKINDIGSSIFNLFQNPKYKIIR